MKVKQKLLNIDSKLTPKYDGMSTNDTDIYNDSYPLLFVYGTLKTGFINNYRLKDSRVSFVGETMTLQQDYLMKSYVTDSGYLAPVIKLCKYGYNIVGELYRVPSDILLMLDKFVGVHNNINERGLTEVKYTKELVWTYFYLGNILDLKNDGIEIDEFLSTMTYILKSYNLS